MESAAYSKPDLASGPGGRRSQQNTARHWRRRHHTPDPARWRTVGERGGAPRGAVVQVLGWRYGGSGGGVRKGVGIVLALCRPASVPDSRMVDLGVLVADA